MPITPPLTAPHRLPVREMPPQKPVAILGMTSDRMPCCSANASSTLSAQLKPVVVNNSLGAGGGIGHENGSGEDG